MSDAWETKWNRTWLASPDACAAMDDKLARRLGRRNRPDNPQVNPDLALSLRCAQTAEFLRDAGRVPANALCCTTLLVLLGELLLCAEYACILREDVVVRYSANDGERRKDGTALRLLRNVFCHPATRAHDELLDFVEHEFRDEDEWIHAIRPPKGETQVSNFNDRRVAFFALGLVDRIGLRQAERWGVRMKGVPKRR